MRHTTLLDVIVFIAIPSGCLVAGQQTAFPEPGKYAVLVSTEQAEVADQANNTEFWHDLVLTYCTLRENGFERDDIFVLYGEGDDFANTHSQYTAPYCDKSTTITDFALSNHMGVVKDNICNVLCCLATGFPAQVDEGGRCQCLTVEGEGLGGFRCEERGNAGESFGYSIPALEDEDFLFVWVKGHGTAITAPDCPTSLWLANTFEITARKYLEDRELAGLLVDLRDTPSTLVLETCHSSGFLDNLESDRRVVMASSQGDAVDPQDSTSPRGCLSGSYFHSYPECDPATGGSLEILHGRFSYWVNAGFQIPEEIETLVSEIDVWKAYTTAERGISSENTCIGQDTTVPQDMSACPLRAQHPAIADSAGIAPHIFIACPHPYQGDESSCSSQTSDPQ